MHHHRFGIPVLVLTLACFVGCGQSDRQDEVNPSWLQGIAQQVERYQQSPALQRAYLRGVAQGRANPEAEFYPGIASPADQAMADGVITGQMLEKATEEVRNGEAFQQIVASLEAMQQ